MQLIFRINLRIARKSLMLFSIFSKYLVLVFVFNFITICFVNALTNTGRPVGIGLRGAGSKSFMPLFFTNTSRLNEKVFYICLQCLCWFIKKHSCSLFYTLWAYYLQDLFASVLFQNIFEDGGQFLLQMSFILLFSSFFPLQSYENRYNIVERWKW